MVCFIQHLSVYLSEQLYVKTADRIFTKILPQMRMWTRKSPWNGRSRPCLDLDVGIFEGTFTTGRQDKVC